jgi:predicted  nucleic acid-binding Zn-ribbon protein
MTAIVRRAANTAASSTLFMMLPVLLLAGCKGRALEEAQQEAREAKATVNKLNYSLKTAAEEIATAKAELEAVRQSRDETQKQMQQLIRERDQASISAQHAQEAVTRLTTQASGQGSMTTALEKQVAELKTLVDEQQKEIDQLRKNAPAQPGAPAADKPSTPDPNQMP